MSKTVFFALALAILLAAKPIHAQRDGASLAADKDGLFSLLDSDRDGSLSKAELEAAPALLGRADKNQDGKLTADEIELQLSPAVPAGINDRFLDPQLDPAEWVNRFEIESREVFAHREAIVDALKLSQGDDIADIGAGTGLFEPLFSQRVGAAGTVYAVDISPKLVKHLKERVQAEGMANVEVVHSQEDSTELKEASIDAAFVCDTYHHFEHHAEMLLSIRTALRPKGKFVVIDFERIPGKSREFILGHVRAGKEVFRREIERSGFVFLEEVKIPGFSENYFLRFEKR